MLINISLTRIKDNQVRDNRIIVESGIENSIFNAQFEKMDKLVFIYGEGQILTVTLPRSETLIRKTIEDLKQSIAFWRNSNGRSDN